ncbi:hypothetical protein MBLNU230_g0050t1 [Neophaeotheca triangularis]
MREANFSIPNANKASVGITTALYDRRALDCTSTLPLITSLNNLAYLTTSSGRIRDILTVDGGIERLVCILKEGRSKDMMDMWKWNLAFQCIVNIGVRGSEAVRTRVVEADMVPVIATILDNYFRVVEKCRERAELESKRKVASQSFSASKSGNSSRNAGRTGTINGHRSERSRRQAPPPIAIPETSDTVEEGLESEVTPTAPAANLSLSSPPDGSQSRSRQSHLGRMADAQPRQQFTSSNPRSHTQSEQRSRSSAGFQFMRPVRDTDRLPSMAPATNAELSSQPQSPTTPHGPSVDRSMAGTLDSESRPRRRPSIRHQLSTSGSDDDGQIEEVASDPDSNDTVEASSEPVVGIQNMDGEGETDIVMRDIVDDDTLLVDSQRDNNDLTLASTNTGDNNGTFNITHRSATGDGSMVPTMNMDMNGATTPTVQNPHPRNAFGPPNATPTPGPPAIALNNGPTPLHTQNAGTIPTWYPSPTPSHSSNTPTNSAIFAAMPKDEDVLMSLQLLAYVSKYCNLRSYFQATHLVPRLKIGADLRLLDLDYDPANDTGAPTAEQLQEDWDNEFVTAPGDEPYNIFPLIERFTAKPSRQSSTSLPSAYSNSNLLSPRQGDMQYWAGVVMRNLCRKDEARGGIRQCAYWQCGKWEQFQRQFAKCRRCRRTKYCSKECQKGAWGSHRFWCVAAEEGNREGAPDPTSASFDVAPNAGEGSSRQDLAIAGNGSGSSRHGHRHRHHHRHGHGRHGQPEGQV